jgi:hypothetical protein
MRRARRFLIVTLAVIGTLVLGARLYLGSALAAEQVRERLESVYGSRIAIAAVDIGFTSSDLKGLQLYEAGPDAPDSPWATANDVDAALTLWDILRGNTTPDDVTLTGAAITLRFNAEGRLLTRFPEPKGPSGGLGVIHVRGGQVTLQQVGHPDLIVTDVDADLRPDGNRLALTGSLAVPRWGSWTVEGFWDRASNATSLTLKTPRAEFTQQQLEQLPFVSAKVWRQVRIDGATSVDFTLTRDEDLRFRIDLDVSDARLHVPSIDLHADNVRGHVVVESRLVHLSDVIGVTADGHIRTDAALDFRSNPDVLRFKIVVDRLQLRSLPQTWFRKGGVAKAASGRLSGNADLEVRITNGKALTSGEGHGILNEVKVGLLPMPPIRLRMMAEGKDFIFAPERRTSDRRQPAQPPTWVVAETTWSRMDLPALLENLDLKPPFPLDGRLSLDLCAAVPLDTAADPQTYRLRGKARLPWVRVAGIDVHDVRTRIDYEEGVLQMADLTGRIAERLPPACGPPLDGTLAGTARCELFPALNLATRLQLDHIALASLLVPDTSGTLTAEIDLGAPIARCADAVAWTGAVHAQGDDVVLHGLSIHGPDVDVHLRDGHLSVTKLQARVEDGSLTGSGTLTLAAPQRFTGTLTLHDAGPATLQRLAANAAVTGQLEATANLHGQLQPFGLDADGTAAAANLHLGPAVIDRLALRWCRDGDRIAISGLKARLYEGQLTGSGQVPVTAAAAGHAELEYQDINLGAVGEQLLALPVPLRGSVSGAITANLPPVGAGEPRDISIELRVQAPRIDIERLPTRQLQGTLAYRGGDFDYHLSGMVCAGSYHLDGRLVAGSTRPTGTLRVDTLSLGRLCEEANAPAFLQPLRGHMDVRFGYGGETGSGQFVLNQLRWGERELAESIEGDLLFGDDTLRIRNINGLLEQGLLRGQASLHLREPDLSSIEVTVDGVAPGRVLAPWPELADRVEGPLDVYLFSRLGSEWSGRVNMALPRGSIAGIDVADAHLPIDFTFVPAEGRGQLDLREGSAQVAHGRALSRASLTWGSSTRLDGDVRFFDLELRNLLRSAADASQLGAGQLSGRLTFEAQNLRSLDDLSALLDARLHQTQALEMPVLRQLTPYIAPGQSSAFFQAGECQVRLSGGVVRVQRLRLIGSLIQLVVEGTINLAGHLNLDVNANTARLPANLPAAQALGLLGDATNFLASRLVHLHVGGTVRSPTVTVEPVLGAVRR